MLDALLLALTVFTWGAVVAGALLTLWLGSLIVAVIARTKAQTANELRLHSPR